MPELPTGDARRTLLLRYGELVASLGGTYRTAGDMNISPADLDIVQGAVPVGVRNDRRRRQQRPRHGDRRAARHSRGVEHVFGSPDLAGRTVLVQGAGAVGHDLARFLAEAGAEVLVSDVDEARAAAAGGTVVPAADALTTECDVYSPCAVGGTLNAESIPALRCRIVAGSANNQLATPEDAQRLHERGILYAPDYVINAGGVIQLLGLEDHGWDEAELERNLADDRRHAARALPRRGRRRHHARRRGRATRRGAHRAEARVGAGWRPTDRSRGRRRADSCSRGAAGC